LDTDFLTLSIAVSVDHFSKDRLKEEPDIKASIM
jgi:hypothetical protein